MITTEGTGISGAPPEDTRSSRALAGTSMHRSTLLMIKSVVPGDRRFLFRVDRKAFRGALVACCLLLFADSARILGDPRTRGPDGPHGDLRVEIKDHDTRRAVYARCYLTDLAGKFWSPAGAINYDKPPERDFIVQGGFSFSLPPGNYSLAVERGLEYRPARREIEIRAGETRAVKVELSRWINMNQRGWYSADLHNHRKWQEMAQLLLAEDLNLAPTLTEWIWEDKPISKAPRGTAADGAVHVVDSTHVYSVFDTEIERLREGPGAVDLVGLKGPVEFKGYLVSPPNSVFADVAHRQGGYVDAEKITWRDSVALVALGYVDFAGIAYNQFHRHGVYLETDSFGMIPKEKPEYRTPEGMPLWAMDVYYKFLNCGFKLPASAGSASAVFASPLGFDRVYVHLRGQFNYHRWFQDLKAGRSFATNGPILFLTVNGHEPGDTIAGPTGAGRPPVRLRVNAETSTATALDRMEIIWKGKVIKKVAAGARSSKLRASFDFEAHGSGWIAARAFDKPGESVRFAQTSPVYLKVGQDPGIVPEDAKFFLNWIDREISFYQNLPRFRSEPDRQAMLALFRRARKVYERLAAKPAR